MRVKVIHTAWEDMPVHVADVIAPAEFTVEQALEFAFRWTNNVDTDWSIEPSTRVEVKGNATRTRSNGQSIGLRSTCVGDIMEAGGKIWTVASYGFTEV